MNRAQKLTVRDLVRRLPEEVQDTLEYVLTSVQGNLSDHHHEHVSCILSAIQDDEEYFLPDVVIELTSTLKQYIVKVKKGNDNFNVREHLRDYLIKTERWRVNSNLLLSPKSPHETDLYHVYHFTHQVINPEAKKEVEERRKEKEKARAKGVIQMFASLSEQDRQALLNQLLGKVEK